MPDFPLGTLGFSASISSQTLSGLGIQAPVAPVEGLGLVFGWTLGTEP